MRYDTSTATCKDNDYAYSLALSDKAKEQQEMITSFCAGCPMRVECLERAVNEDAYGVWGGTTRAYRVKYAGAFVSPAVR